MLTHTESHTRSHSCMCVCMWETVECVLHIQVIRHCLPFAFTRHSSQRAAAVLSFYQLTDGPMRCTLAQHICPARRYSCSNRSNSIAETLQQTHWTTAERLALHCAWRTPVWVYSHFCRYNAGIVCMCENCYVANGCVYVFRMYATRNASRTKLPNETRKTELYVHETRSTPEERPIKQLEDRKYLFSECHSNGMELRF